MASMRINVGGPVVPINPTVPSSAPDPISQLFQTITQIAKAIEQDVQKQSPNRFAPTAPGVTKQNDPAPAFNEPEGFVSPFVASQPLRLPQVTTPQLSTEYSAQQRARTTPEKYSDPNTQFGMQLIRQAVVERENRVAVSRPAHAEY